MERGARSSNRELQSNHNRDLSFSIQDSQRVSPARAVEQYQSDIFVLLLDAICQHLPIHCVYNLIAWADITYGINATNIIEIFNELVGGNIIGPLNLSVLRDIFEAMGQIHLVHLIDNYLLGDYHLLTDMS